MKKKLLIVFIALSMLMQFSYCNKIELTGLALYLPTKDDVKGWQMLEEPRFFQADNLWEYINGGADAYLTYGFKEVVTVGYENKDSESDILVDVYQMENPVNTFGIYSSERSPGYNYIEMGTEGYLAGTSLNFWKGSYYIKIVSHTESDAVKEEMRKFADAIALKITETSEEPAAVAMFPADGMIEKSVRYIARDILGQTFFTNGFSADYTVDGKDLKAFLIFLSDEETAKSSFSSYKDFIGKTGELWNNTTRRLARKKELGDDIFACEDSFYGKSVVFRKGATVGGILGVNEMADGEAFIKKIKF